MDLLYPLGTQSVWSDNELRFSLRSLKYLQGFDRIFVIGHKPEWLTNVEHIPFQDTPLRKALSIKNKIVEACGSNISKDFLMMNDDYFFLKPTEIKKIPDYHQGTLKDAYLRNSGERYRDIIGNTIGAFGEKAKYFDIHYPIRINKGIFTGAMTYHDWKKDFLVKTTYCLVSDNRHEEREDCKIYHPLRQGEIIKKIEGKDLFSISSAAVCYQLECYMNKIYPEKSRFEL